MLQIVQHNRQRSLIVESIPEPVVRLGHVLIQNECSVVSAGTEKSIVDTASKSLLAKARHRPDLVRQVLRKMKTIGWRKTFEQVSAKLDTSIALGYAKVCRGFVPETAWPQTVRMPAWCACQSTFVRWCPRM
jgi:hypothetical protein